MRHSEPRIQELVEALQGAVRVISDPPIRWSVYEEFGAYKLSVAVLPDSRHNPLSGQAYAMQFTVDRRALTETHWWASFKQGVVRQCLVRMADDSKPADEQDIEYVADPRGMVNR